MTVNSQLRPGVNLLQENKVTREISCNHRSQLHALQMRISMNGMRPTYRLRSSARCDERAVIILITFSSLGTAETSLFDHHHTEHPKPRHDVHHN